MIKTLKRIDLQGNEVWQEVIVCNRCKEILEPTDFVYETKWTSRHPVKIESGIMACSFSQGTNPVKHICEKCQVDVESFLEGKDIEKKNTTILTTFEERVASYKKSLRNESTPDLKEFRNSCMCSCETARAIDEILKERSWKEVF